LAAKHTIRIIKKISFIKYLWEVFLKLILAQNLHSFSWGRCMTDKHLEKASITEPLRPLAKSKNPAGIDSFFKKNGVNDGRLIATRDRVTYTLLFAGEAVAIHFDMNKRELFIKGHRLLDLETLPETPALLNHFKLALAADPATRGALLTLNAVLSNLANRV